MAQVHDVINPPLVFFPIGAALVQSQPLAVDDLHVLFVDRQPVFNTVAERLEADADVVVEQLDHPPVAPAAQLVHPHRHVVVIQGDDRRNVVCKQLVDQIVVKLNAFRIDLAVGSRNDPRPGERKAVRGEAALCHQLYVFFPVVVMIGGD